VIAEEVSRGAVVVVVTHDPHLVEALPGARVLMDRGRIGVF
jgi:hypothetical protein